MEEEYENKEKKQMRRAHLKNQEDHHKKGEKIWLYEQNQHYDSTKFN